MSDQIVTTLLRDSTEAGQAPEHALLMSDYLLLGALVLALFIVDDPYGAQYQHAPSTRHLPLVLSLVSILLASASDLLRRAGRASSRSWSVIKAAYPLMLLAGWIIAGSLYARLSEGIQDTFLNAGVYMMLTLLTERGIVDWRFSLRESRRLYRVVLAGAATLVLGMCGFFALSPTLSSDLALPDGNPGYGVRAYEKAFQRFNESPVYGTLFSDRSTTHFTAFHVEAFKPDNQLPTHSDLLDLASSGGVPAIALLLWSYARIAQLSWRSILAGNTTRPIWSEGDAAAHVFACISLSGIAVYAVNPLMLQPDKGMLVWVNLGLLLGMCVQRAALNKPTTGPVQ
jgi:hypothetical protein